MCPDEFASSLQTMQREAGQSLAAFGTGWCGPSFVAVYVWFCPPPVAGSQLVDVDCNVSVVNGDARR